MGILSTNNKRELPTPHVTQADPLSSLSCPSAPAVKNVTLLINGYYTETDLSKKLHLAKQLYGLIGGSDRVPTKQQEQNILEITKEILSISDERFLSALTAAEAAGMIATTRYSGDPKEVMKLQQGINQGITQTEFYKSYQSYLEEKRSAVYDSILSDPDISKALKDEKYYFELEPQQRKDIAIRVLDIASKIYGMETPSLFMYNRGRQWNENAYSEYNNIFINYYCHPTGCALVCSTLHELEHCHQKQIVDSLDVSSSAKPGGYNSTPEAKDMGLIFQQCLNKNNGHIVAPQEDFNAYLLQPHEYMANIARSETPPSMDEYTRGVPNLVSFYDTLKPQDKVLALNAVDEIHESGEIDTEKASGYALQIKDLYAQKQLFEVMAINAKNVGNFSAAYKLCSQMEDPFFRNELMLEIRFDELEKIGQAAPTLR